MVAWVVIDRRHLPRAPRGPRQSRKSRPIRALPLPVRHFSVPTFQPSDVRKCFDLSPLFSDTCALFCSMQNAISFVSNHFRTLCTKPPGVGVGAPC